MANFSNPAAQWGYTKFTVSSTPGVGRYTTIQEAVTAANAAGGGVIAIYPGTYTESIAWNKNISAIGGFLGGATNFSVPSVEIIGNQTFDEDGSVAFANIHFSSAAGTTYVVNASGTNVSTAAFFQCYIESTALVLQSISATGTSNLQFENCYIFSDGGPCVQSENGTLSLTQTTVYNTAGSCLVLGASSFSYVNNCFIESTTNYAVDINSTTASLFGNNSHYKTTTAASPCWYYSANGSAESWGENFESDDAGGFYISTALAGSLAIGSQTVTGTASNINPAITSTFFPAGSPVFSTLICTGKAAFGTGSVDPNAEIVVQSTATPQAVKASSSITAVDGSNDQAAFFSDVIFQPSSGSTQSASFYSDAQFAAPPAQTIASASDFLSSARFTSNVGTITNFRGFYFDGGGTGAGTITNAYGGYFTDPLAGTNKTALYSDNCSIGITGIIPPTNGLVVSGRSIFGASSGGAQNQVTVSNASFARGIQVQGTQTAVDGSSHQHADSTTNTFSPTTGSTLSTSYNANSVFAAPVAQTMATAASYYAQPLYTGNAGTITNSYGYYYNGGGPGVGTITTAYAAYFINPTAGSTNIATYTDNLNIGYAGTAPPTNGIIASGRSLFGVSSGGTNNQITVSTANEPHAIQTDGTQTAVDGGNNQHHFSSSSTFAPTSGSTISSSFEANPIFASPAAQTIATAASFRSSPRFTGNAGTITTSYGYYFDGGGAGSGTITNSYGGYFTNPTAGTNKAAFYSDNASIGYAATTPPTNGLIVSGSVAIGSSSATASAALAVTSTTKGFLPPSMTKTQKNAISTPATGLTVYDNTVNSLQIYNGTDWTYPLGDYVSTAINYNANPGDYIIAVSNTGAARTVTLPAVANLDEGKIYIIKDTSGTCGTNANAITVATTTGTIDGASNYLITQNYGFVQLAHDGTNFFVIGQGPVNSLISTSSTSFNLSAKNIYRTTAGTAVSAALPSTASIGDTITVTQNGAGVFTIAQGASQLIRFGTSVTTTGTGGSIKSTQQGCSITIVCVVANTQYQVLNSIGNFIVT